MAIRIAGLPFRRRHHAITVPETTNVLATASPRPKRRVWHIPRAVWALLFIVICVSAGSVGIVWWEERPLAVAEEQLAKGQWRQSQTTVSQFLRQHPQHGRALSLKARIQAIYGSPEAAIELYERVGAASPADLHAFAQAYLKLQRWSLALPVLKVLRAGQPDNQDILHELAACNTKLGNFADAVNAAEEFSNLPGCEARGKLMLGTIQHERGNLHEAAAAWGAVLRLDPDLKDLQIDPQDFLEQYGSVLFSLGDTKQSIEMFQRSLAILESAEVRSQLGSAYAQAGESEKADAAFRKSLEEPGDSHRARVGLAQLALSRRKADEALEWLQPLAGDRPGKEVAFLMQRCYTMLGQRDEAEKWRLVADEIRKGDVYRTAADQILQDYPESNWAIVIRAHKFAESGNWDEAGRLLKPIADSAKDQPFIQALIQAVEARGPLPPLSGLPIKSF